MRHPVATAASAQQPSRKSDSWSHKHNCPKPDAPPGRSKPAPNTTRFRLTPRLRSRPPRSANHLILNPAPGTEPRDHPPLRRNKPTENDPPGQSTANEPETVSSPGSARQTSTPPRSPPRPTKNPTKVRW